MSKKNTIDWLTIVLADSAGGAEINQANIMYHMMTQGKSCTAVIITKKNQGRWTHLEDNCNIIYFPTKSVFIGYLILVLYIPILFLRNKIRYVFTSQTLINSMVGFYRKLRVISTSTSIIVRESNSIFELIKGYKLIRYKIAYVIGYSAVDLIICQTEYMKAGLLKNLPWIKKKSKVVVISNPFNIEAIDNSLNPSLEYLQNFKFLVGAGRLVEAKGFDILIDAFKLIEDKLNDFRLLILGEGPDRNKLEEKIRKLSLEEKVLLKGVVPNVYPYFKHAEICVMSSRIEGFPNVLLQMMSQNTKVVSTLSAGDINDMPGINKCPINDTQALSREILNTLKSDTSLNRSLFDRFLSDRNLSSFCDKMFDNLNPNHSEC